MREPSANQRRNGGWLHQLRSSSSLQSDRSHCGDGDSIPRKRQRKGNNVAVATEQSFPNLESVIQAWESRLGSHSRKHVYEDAQGEPVGLVARWDRPDGKVIRQASRQEDGQWTMRAMPGPRPLFGLAGVLAAPRDAPVLIVEGEKCVESLRSIGFQATTWAGGCKGVGSTDFGPLARRDLVLTPDHDSVGQEAMDEIAERLAKLRPQPTVRLLTLETYSDGTPLPQGGDIADWLQRGGTSDDLNILLTRAESVELPVDAGPRVWRPFPLETLPSTLRRYVVEAARVTQVDPALVAGPALVAAAAAIGSAREIHLKSDWAEPSILWLASVAPSGAGKTPAAAKALRPTRLHDERDQAENIRLGAEHLAAIERYQVEKQAWKAGGAEGAPPVAPTAPEEVRRLIGDVTVERLAEILADNSRGVLMACDELSGHFGSMDRYRSGRGGGDRACYLSIWSAEPIRIDRKTGERRSIYVPSPRLSLYGGVQPDLLPKLIGADDIAAGLPARFLWCAPPPIRQRFKDDQIHPRLVEAYDALIDALFQLEGDRTSDNPATPVPLTLSEGARSVYADFYDRLSEQQEDASPMLAGVLSKLRAYAGRLALVLHCLAEAENPSEGVTMRVGVDTMHAAITLVEWFKSEAIRLFAQRSETDEERELRELAEWVSRKGGNVTARDLARGPRKYRTASKAEAALQRLVNAGHGAWRLDEHDGGPGKPTRRFWLAS